MDKLNQIKVIYELTKDLVDDELSMIDEGKLHCTYNFYQKIISTEKIFTKIEYIVLYLHDEVEPLEPLEEMELEKYFPNLKKLTLSCHKEEYEPLFVNLNPLLKLNNLYAIELIGNSLAPYGLGSDWGTKLLSGYGGKVNFEIWPIYNDF